MEPGDLIVDELGLSRPVAFNKGKIPNFWSTKSRLNRESIPNRCTEIALKKYNELDPIEPAITIQPVSVEIFISAQDPSAPDAQRLYTYDRSVDRVNTNSYRRAQSTCCTDTISSGVWATHKSSAPFALCFMGQPASPSSISFCTVRRSARFGFGLCTAEMRENTKTESKIQSEQFNKITIDCIHLLFVRGYSRSGA